MSDAAVIIGNTDGIGLALTRQLLDRGFEITGISRRPSTLVHEAYRHCVIDVCNPRYVDTQMAKSPRKPFMISAEDAARRILQQTLGDRIKYRINIPWRAALVFGAIAPCLRLIVRLRRSRISVSSGNSGVRFSNRILLFAFSGGSPLTLSTFTSAK